LRAITYPSTTSLFVPHIYEATQRGKNNAFFTIDSLEQTVSITVNADMSNYRPNKRQRYHCQVALADALNKRVPTTWRSDISDLFKHLDLKLQQSELQLCYHLRVLSTTKITGLRKDSERVQQEAPSEMARIRLERMACLAAGRRA
jgi:hypothetical protein